jgi:hypothetical protein
MNVTVNLHMDELDNSARRQNVSDGWHTAIRGLDTTGYAYVKGVSGNS